MPKLRLTDDERSIRRSRGISIVRLLPFVAMFVAYFVMAFDGHLFQQCLGKPLNSGRGAGVAKMIFALPCSPYYLRDFREHLIAIGLFAVGLGLAIPQILWIKRHEAYWNSVRAKERLKRAEASADKKVKQLGGE